MYKKPSNVTYTEMCIYIDENVYKENHNEELIYQYLYHISYMLAKKASLFNKNHYYDDFAIFCAGKLYMRLLNKKQYEYDEEGNPKLEKIKSILNYTKKLLYPLKVDFEQEEYSQTITPQQIESENTYSFNQILNSYIDNLDFCDFNLTLNDVEKTCNKFLKTIPYKENTKEWLNIYTSVLLTFLNMVTLNNKKVDRLKHLSSTNRLTDTHIINAFKEEINTKAILFHLDENMNDYIIVLARELKNIIAKDLSDILDINVSNNIELVELSVKDYLNDINGDDDEY